MPDIIKEAEEKMKKAVENAKKNFAGVRTGRASASLLDQITVEYYGAQAPLKQLASIAVPEARLIVIQPFDKNAIKAIEKAIQSSELGINPVSDGGKIRLPMPPLTEERRKELVKIVKKESEDSKVALRNIRRDAIAQLKKAKDEKQISEDAEKNQEAATQKLIEKFTAEIDAAVKIKENEIMEV